MKYNISKTVQEMQPSGIRQFFDLVLGMEDVISLGVGEPDFTTPWNICESAIFSLEQGYTSYTSNKGLMKLRVKLSQHLARRYGMQYDPENQILITVGVSEALDLALRAIVNPGDKILVPQPCYVSYWPVVELAGGRPVIILTAKTGFKLTPRLIEENCDGHTKGVIFNYPSNPTGISYTKSELEEIKKAFLRRGLIIISDEIYGDLTYDFKHTPFPTLKGAMPNTLYLNGFSKAHAMTGWRIGYACGPEPIIAAMTKIHQYTMLCAPITGQIAACEALSESAQRSVEGMKREYNRRRNYIVGELGRLGLDCVKPHGAFYVFVRVKNTGLSGMDFATGLLKKERVAVVPGSAFGLGLEDYIRISYAASFDNLKEAVVRIGKFLGKK